MILSLTILFLCSFVRDSTADPIDNVLFTSGRLDTLEVRITHFEPGDEPINNQVWSIVESQSGWIFFAQEEGILANRGSEWELIKTPNSTSVLSLAIERKPTVETIYFGEKGDFGSISVDTAGEFVATSLRHLISENISFGNVWNTHVVGDDVFFQTRHYVFRYSKNDSITYWYSETGFHNSFSIADRYFVREFGNGLKEYRIGFGLELMEGGELLAEEIVSGIVQSGKEGVQIWTQSKGLFTQKTPGSTLQHLSLYGDELQAISENTRLYAVTKVTDTVFAVGTLGKGLLLVDQGGAILNHLDKQAGFPDNTVNYIEVSNTGGLWVALDNEGAAFIDGQTTILRLGKDHGINGYINYITRLDEELFIATGSGLYSASEKLVSNSEGLIFVSNSPQVYFDQIVDDSMIWQVAVFQDQMWIATENGVKYIEKQGSGFASRSCIVEGEEEKEIPTHAYSLVTIQNGTRLLVGMQDGLGEVEFIPKDSGTSDCIVKRAILDGQNREVRSLLETSESLWMGTAYHGYAMVQKSDLDPVQLSSRLIELKSSSDHSPGRNDVVLWDGQVVGVNEEGIFALSTSSNGFINVEALEFQGSEEEPLISKATNWISGRAWVVTRDSIMSVERLNGQFTLSQAPDALKFSKSGSSAIIADEVGQIWFNDGSDLIRYHENRSFVQAGKLKAHISRVVINQTGIELYSGKIFGQNGGIGLAQEQSNLPTLGYYDRNISVDLTASEYANLEDVQYKFLINGEILNNELWNAQSHFVITNLKEGNHQIQVQAKNEWGQISDETRFSFTILPPWYRTFWAYFAYVVLIIGLTFSSKKYISMRRANKAAQEQAKELEREREVVKKLQEANDRLIQANKLKDEFLATTSHELRTPLTAILGFTDVLKDEIPKDAEYREFLDIIGDSGSRLMETLNSLLDLAKLRAGIMEINLEPVDLYQLSMQVHLKFQESAVNKGLRLKVEKPESRTAVMADVHAVERILHNLIGNAVKFTSDGGVTITLESVQDRVLLKVRDTGIGIESEFLPELFDAFIQESDGLSRSYEGTGLGLAITSGLVSLLDASISVESEKGVGSTFIVNLPVAEQIGHGRHRLMGMRPGVRS